MKRWFVCFMLGMSLFLVASCSSNNVKPEDPRPAPDDEPEQAIPTAEAAPEEGPIFTYEGDKISGPAEPEIYLTFQSEPVQIPGQGYVKFKGAITGDRPVAVVEIAGKGVVLNLGERVGEYVVRQITEGYVRLVRQQNNVGAGLVPARTPNVGAGLVPARNNVDEHNNE